MTKEDKQIIDRAIKENWRIGDRTRLKRLLKKNLELYRENVELENENTELKAKEKQIEKVEYTLKKIIETVQNDNIDEYGARLVLIKDFAFDCLEELRK